MNDHPYAQHFNRPGTAQSYLGKFEHRIDNLRHVYELEKMVEVASGELFDCSIGTGRFIGKLPKVTAYCGMDYSEDFLRYIRSTYPNVPVQRGDLFKGIEQPTDRFDTVICIRTLSSLNSVEPIVSEMLRICRPGGSIIFDYGTVSKTTVVDGNTIQTGSMDVEKTLKMNGISEYERYPLDAAFTRIKRSRVFSRLINMRLFKWIPDSLFLNLERYLSNSASERVLYIARKPKKL